MDGQISKENERAQGGQVTGKRVGKTRKKSGHPLEDGMSATANKGGQAASWLKSLLPESQNGWWEVSVKGKGFAVKFRWRDADRQTLLFPQVTDAQFIALTQSASEEAAIILHDRITANLHSFLLDPAKREKALVVAAKLGINLSVPAVHSLMGNEI
jgi:hypothetical protein